MSHEKARGDSTSAWGRSCSVDLKGDIGYGIGPVLNLDQNDRTMISFRPITIAPEETTPLTYNVSLIGPEGQTILFCKF